MLWGGTRRNDLLNRLTRTCRALLLLAIAQPLVRNYSERTHHKAPVLSHRLLNCHVQSSAGNHPTGIFHLRSEARTKEAVGTTATITNNQHRGRFIYSYEERYSKFKWIHRSLRRRPKW